MKKEALEKLEKEKKEASDKLKKKKDDKEKRMLTKKGKADSDEEEEEKEKELKIKKEKELREKELKELKERANGTFNNNTSETDKAFEEFKSKKKLELKFVSSDSVEVELYLQLLLIILLIDTKRISDALTCVNDLFKRMVGQEKRSLDDLAAKVFYYYARVNELNGTLSDIRADLLAAYRTSNLHHNEVAEATLVNYLLRSYLQDHLYDQADKLTAKTTFPSSASNNEHARYFYYLGRIKSVQLEYVDASKYLTLAIRKAPQSGAIGFRLTVNKLSCIVQLLVGEIPDRQIFDDDELSNYLKPYFKLVEAVKVGDLVNFKQVMSTYHQLFQKDRTYNLILRLRHNVIKAGLKKISLSYSRISFIDICKKLKLESAVDAESIVSKAIRDGVIDATINHEEGFVKINENIDVYSSHDPQIAFHARIAFALNTHNDAVKAMRYEDKVETKKDDNDNMKEGDFNIDDFMDMDMDF